MSIRSTHVCSLVVSRHMCILLPCLRQQTQPSTMPRKHMNDPGRYKTVLCVNYQVDGTCPYGQKCRFAHGVQQLRERVSKTDASSTKSPPHQPSKTFLQAIQNTSTPFTINNVPFYPSLPSQPPLPPGPPPPLHSLLPPSKASTTTRRVWPPLPPGPPPGLRHGPRPPPPGLPPGLGPLVRPSLSLDPPPLQLPRPSIWPPLPPGSPPGSPPKSPPKSPPTLPLPVPDSDMSDWSDVVKAIEKLQEELSVGRWYSETICVVCEDAIPTHGFIPCKHLCVCLECANGYKMMKNKVCYICQSTAELVQKNPEGYHLPEGIL